MGTYYRYTLALLIALSTCSASAAIRTKATTSVSSAVKATSTPQVSADFQTPNGALRYYGPEKYYALDNSLNAQTGSSVGPTVRAINPTNQGGTTSFPYGPGAYTGKNTNQILKVKPAVDVPKSKIINQLKKGLKVTPAQIAAQAAISAAIAGVGWLMDEGTLVKKISDGEPISPNQYGWVAAGGSWCGGQKFSSPAAAQTCITAAIDAYLNSNFKVEPGTITFITSSFYQISTKVTYLPNGSVNTDGYNTTISKQGTCPAPYVVIGDSCVTGEPQYAPVTDSDYTALDDYMGGQNAPFFDRIVREACAGSPSPEACFEEMRGNDSLSGPSSMQGPSMTTTTSTQNPDGSVSTTGTTTTTNYTFNYGDNYFDTNTTVTKTTTKDGQTVSTETQEDTTEPEENPEEQTAEDYTFTDTPFADVPSFYDQKYPDGLQGVWNSAKSDFENSEFVSFLNSFVPSFSGSCPSWQMSFSIGRLANLGSHDFGNLCYVFDFVKVCMLLGAAFLSRALIFGG